MKTSYKVSKTVVKVATLSSFVYPFLNFFMFGGDNLSL